MSNNIYKEIENETDVVKKLAVVLHHIFCSGNHTDWCGWYYDDGSWSRDSRVEYLEKANNMLAICKEEDINPVTIIKMILSLKRRKIDFNNDPEWLQIKIGIENL